MEDNTTFLTAFILGIIIGVTSYSVYTAFGPLAYKLRDPFEEHKD